MEEPRTEGVLVVVRGEGEGRESETWQMNLYTYQDEHASIHVVNVHKTYKHNMIHTKLIVDKVGREHSSIVKQLSGYIVCS